MGRKGFWSLVGFVRDRPGWRQGQEPLSGFPLLRFRFWYVGLDQVYEILPKRVRSCLRWKSREALCNQARLHYEASRLHRLARVA